MRVVVDVGFYAAHLLVGRVYHCMTKAESDVVNMLIYFWIILSAFVVCSVYFWKNNELGLIKVVAEDKSSVAVADSAQDPVVKTTVRKLKVKSTKVHLHKLNRVNDNIVSEINLQDSKTSKILAPNSGTSASSNDWVNEVILWVFQNTGGNGSLSRHLAGILNEILDSNISRNLLRSLEIKSISLGSSPPEIHKIVREAGTEAHLLSVMCELKIPKLVIGAALSQTADGTATRSECVVYLSQSSVQMDLRLALQQPMGVTISFREGIMANCHIDGEQMDSVTKRWVEHQILFAFEKGGFEFEMSTGRAGEHDADLSRQARRAQLDKGSSTVGRIHFQHSLTVALEDTPHISVPGRRDPGTRSFVKDYCSLPRKLLCIQYAVIPFLFNERADHLMFCVHIDAPPQYFECPIDSLKVLDTGIEDIFVSLKATFFLGEPLSSLRLVLQMENGDVLRSGEIDLTDADVDSMTFINVGLQVPGDREDETATRHDIEYVTLSVMLSHSYLTEVDEQGDTSSCLDRASIPSRKMYCKETCLENIIFSEASEHSEEETIEYGNPDNALFESNLLKSLDQYEEPSKTTKPKWLKQLPIKSALKRYKNRLYHKMQIPRKAVVSVWTRRMGWRNKARSNRVANTPSLRSIQIRKQLQESCRTFHSCPKLTFEPGELSCVREVGNPHQNE